MSEVAKKNFIVTGASGGIGNSIVEKLSKNGGLQGMVNFQ